MIDFSRYRQQFPALKQQHNGKTVIRFDNAAGTQVPQIVIDRVADFAARNHADSGKRSRREALPIRDETTSWQTQAPFANSREITTLFNPAVTFQPQAVWRPLCHGEIKPASTACGRCADDCAGWHARFWSSYGSRTHVAVSGVFLMADIVFSCRYWGPVIRCPVLLANRQIRSAPQ